MTIFLSVKADKQLRKLPKQIHKALVNKIETLAFTYFPQGAKRLVNRPGWRIRWGDYRILYTVDQRKKEITVLSVAHRKEAYRIS